VVVNLNNNWFYNGDLKTRNQGHALFRDVSKELRTRYIVRLTAKLQCIIFIILLFNIIVKLFSGHRASVIYNIIRYNNNNNIILPCSEYY